MLFFPIYLLGRVAVKKCESPGEILGDVLRGLRDRGFTAGKYVYIWYFLFVCLFILFNTFGCLNVQG